MQASLLLIIELALCCLSESRFVKQQAPMRPFLDCDPVHEAAVGVGFDLTASYGRRDTFRKPTQLLIDKATELLA